MLGQHILPRPLRKGTIKIEAKKARIFTDHGSRKDIEDIVISLLRNGFFCQETPKISLPGIFRHSSDDFPDSCFTPVISCHHKEAGSLCLGVVEILEVSRCRFRCFFKMETLVQGIIYWLFIEGPDVKVILFCCHRDHLPDPFRMSIFGLWSNRSGFEITFLQRHVEEMGRQVVLSQRSYDGGYIIV